MDPAQPQVGVLSGLMRQGMHLQIHAVRQAKMHYLSAPPQQQLRHVDPPVNTASGPTVFTWLSV